ncbi:GGDEF domain-containing protein [Agitococcus lubricus]|uniref:diguanylate cyclase n=1 Tax=Agitococcus lubricus TaxID=1077255 RepID=A0A2T5IV14_9GAMM|nr:GGDEF domain-containing protein [Agitococcus lubricus]PTQ87722.1 diguanylate cyclase (GGDEF)-like protein [Agitococcus lubricus]
MSEPSLSDLIKHYKHSFLSMWLDLFKTPTPTDHEQYLCYLGQKLHHRIMLSAPIVTLLIIIKVSLYFSVLSGTQLLGVLMINFLCTDASLIALLVISLKTTTPDQYYYQKMFALASMALFSCNILYAFTVANHIYYPYQIIELSILVFLWVFNYPYRWIINTPLFVLGVYCLIFLSAHAELNYTHILELLFLGMAFAIGVFYSLVNGANEYHLFTLLKESEEQAITDSLTQLYNRKGFTQHYQQLAKIATREHKAIYLAILDIDNFKQINDSLGHDMGDKVITQVAQQLQTLFKRPLDLVARWGGEEFIVCWCSDQVDNAFVMGQKTCTAIATHQHDATTPFNVTVSMGITQLQLGQQHFDVGLKQADLALYQAKHEGKNCFRIYAHV